MSGDSRPGPNPMLWILRDRKPVAAGSLTEWAAWFEQFDNRRVADDSIEQPEHDPVRVSTVFLGIDHNFGGAGPPLLFETLVFGGPLDGETYRYATWDQAEAGHRLLTDEAVLEGRVAAWEVRERLNAFSTRFAVSPLSCLLRSWSKHDEQTPSTRPRKPLEGEGA